MKVAVSVHLQVLQLLDLVVSIILALLIPSRFIDINQITKEPKNDVKIGSVMGLVDATPLRVKDLLFIKAYELANFKILNNSTLEESEVSNRFLYFLLYFLYSSINSSFLFRILHYALST